MLDLLKEYGIHLFSILLLLIIFVINKLKKETYTFSMRLFYHILFINIILLILEPFSFIFDGVHTHQFLYVINYAIDSLTIFFTALLVGFWASYIDYKFFKNQRRIKQRWYYQFGTLILLVLLCVNLMYPVLYHVDMETNDYERGPLFYVQYVIYFGIYLYILILMLMHKSKQNIRVIMGVLLFLLFPIVGSIIQLLSFDLYYQFTGLALGVLLIYVFLETTSGNKDYLTNLYSRRILDEYLDSLIESDQNFTMVMIDLDHFKEINDRFGHKKGDEVLVLFSNILLNAKMSRKSVITRLGGDEFLCILVEKDNEDIDLCINKIQDNIKQIEIFNLYGGFGFSYGLLSYDHQMSKDEMLIKIDGLMYEDKNQKR